MTSTHKQRRILVCAVQTAYLALDNVDDYPEDVVTQELIDEFYNGADDDRRIGGPKRKKMALLLRKLRKDERFLQCFKRVVARLRKSMSRNPSRWGFNQPGPKRKYPKVVTRKAQPAKRHNDCAYCGYGLSSSVCGKCHQAGIDGPVIRGTEARKATTYTKWN